MTTVDDAFESWRPIPGHDGYEISSRGRVRSWKQWVGGPRVLKIQVRNGTPSIRFAGKEHIIDALMDQAWGCTDCITRWRRIMLTEREHEELVAILRVLSSDAARRLLVRVRSSKRVRWYDPIADDEFREDTSCAG